MRHPVAQIVCFARLLLVALVFGHTVGAQQPAQPRDPPSGGGAGTATIRGRIVGGDNGIPVRRALVHLSSSAEKVSGAEGAAGATRRAVFSDADGRFEITGLPAGSYSLAVMPGLYRSTYQASSSSAALSEIAAPIAGTKSIELRDGETRAIEIPLRRAGAINGRVVDEFGEPLSRLQIMALVNRRGSEPVTVQTSHTDDRGMFRLFGLADGEYLVAVEARTVSMGPVAPEGERVGIQRTFAPGTLRRDQAVPIRLAGGAEASVEIRVVETPLHDVAGVVVNQAGEPISGAHISLTSAGTSVGSGTPTDANGRFVVRGLAPGEYQLAVNYTPPAPPNAGPGTRLHPPEFVLARIQVTGTVDDLVLVTTKGETFTGTIRFEDGSALDRSVQMSVQAPERRPYTLTPRLEVNGGTFTAEGVFGSLLIRGSAFDRGADAGASVPWHLKAVMLDGRDITDVPTVFSAAHSGRVEVVFSRRSSTLEVQVTDDSGGPAPGGTLVVFGEEDSWVLSSSRTRVIPLPPRKGRALVSGLRAGRYYVAAVSEVLGTASAGVSRDYLEGLKRVATAVDLNDGDKRSLELALARLDR